jgi:uncharacterized phage protein gp47/JayE
VSSTIAANDTTPVLDGRDAPAFVAALLALRAGYVPEWQPGQRGPGAALLQIAAHDLLAIVRRLEQAPDKNKLAFLDLAGVRLVPAQPARAPVVLRLSDDAADVRLPAGTRLAAPPPPGGSTQVTYESERSTGLAAAKLREVVSLWPGRDQYIDHSAALDAEQAFQPFALRDLADVPHVLYIAHDRLLALAGQSAATVTFELTTPSSEFLDIRWEYWDGKLWRGFKDMRPACSNDDAEQLDSTSGLRLSGAYRLEADCAETARTTVGGVEAYWVRGRLQETLPDDPARVLPEVESIRLGTTITRAYTSIWSVSEAPSEEAKLRRLGATTTAVDTVDVRVLDAAGVPLEKVGVGVREIGGERLTGPEGRVSGLVLQSTGPSTIVVRLGSFEQERLFTPDPDTPLELTFTIDMLALDQALADGAAVDLTRPFFPLGPQPQPGSAFYFSHEEAFSKPGARLRLYVEPTATPTDELDGTSSDLPHVVSWEYWNGQRWASLLTSAPTLKRPADFRSRGLIDLAVPPDMAPTTVNDSEGLWMRARLVSGGYGFTKRVALPKAATATTADDFTYFVAQAPALADLRLGYTWQDGPHPPERVLAYNDFQYVDRTDEAVWRGRVFQPFTPVADITPALYLGFDGKLPVDSLGIFFDVVEQRGDSDGPTLVWEYWDGFTWQRLLVGDETRNLRLPGMVSLIGPEDSRPLARFRQPRHWLRVRLNEDGPPGEPMLRAIHPNAVWVVQQQTVADEPLGTSTGQPDQVFTFRQLPILPGQEIEVRELSGLRANVEWRILAAELFGADPRALQELETRLGGEDVQQDVQRGPLRLRRDRTKRVIEAWVRWEERPTLFFSGPADRHYAVNRARGQVLVGDHEHGRVAPAEAEIVARRYRTGGGLVGNVAARSISQVLGPIGGIDEVFNPLPAEGGADGETTELLRLRGPRTVRHRGRAVTAEDYETLAHEASPSVAVARALPHRDPSGRDTPGWVTLVIIPHSAEPRPYPSFGLRERVRRFIAARAPADVVAAEQLVVTGPEYLTVDVAATIVPADPSEAGAVEQAARRAIAGFLHPLSGGQAGHGRAPGEDVWLSDLASVLERVEGVDHVREATLLLDGMAQGEHVRVPDDRIAVAGDIQLRLIGG